MKEKALVQNSADEEQVKKGGEKEKLIRDEALDNLRTVLALSEGRAVLWDLLCKCRLQHSSWSENPHYMAFCEGQRNVGLMLQSMIQEADKGAFLKMIEEANRK